MNRVGVGFDAHAFDDARELVLGGVTVEGWPGLAGHSDADVLSHAVADALLGAAGLGDIGKMFPSDARWKDASSLDLLAEVRHALDGGGWAIVNVDATIVAQAPTLDPFRDQMRANIARSLGTDPQSISIKATTTDGMGFTGRAEGMAAIAVALVEQP